MNTKANHRQIKASELKEGDEVIGVGVMEEAAEALGSTHVRLYVAGRIFDKPADELVTIADWFKTRPS